MDYQLEQLGHERFQELCQAVLLKVFPKLQCFPVGQPDGGRDATSLLLQPDNDDFIVFQIKYRRKPKAEKEPHKWLISTLEEEAPKAARLIPRGAKQYLLITNIPGTAHLEAGSIDKAQAILNEHMPVPSSCWWRDDINRRLDGLWDVKWSYPEILGGSDILRAILERGLSERPHQRISTIRAALTDQFNRDKEVRFKQVELQNSLLDLFVDVPVSVRRRSPGKSSRTNRKQEHVFQHVLFTVGEQDTVSEYRHRYPHRHQVGCAALLLHELVQQHISRVVLEGAPGQGKSTLTQYVCQLHRRRVLDIMVDGRIPDEHRRAPARLPFRIDCRDFATWLRREDPFHGHASGGSPKNWDRSLDSFLAAQVAHHSGGADFTVTDLHSVLELSSCCIVFDGFDEVADIQERRAVVAEINRGLSRIEGLSPSVQTIITSRPAAFSEAPGFSDHTFFHLELEALNSRLIHDYAERWLQARRIEGREARDVRNILRDRLDQPHIGELAKNPMQLAILLSLIQTRGGSLPDKRTALYDSYVDLFFSRESEKSSVVREHRDTLIDIHRFLAWMLHSEAQLKRSRGSIPHGELLDVVQKYLAEEGRDPELAKSLFTGMVERVVALVERVEGLYEFEVQPLREYFAGRHLYDTARYSPPGGEARGTLPDRFDALARDPFWMNVTRFYAGCYSKGELASLVDRLEELFASEDFGPTDHPFELATMLLADWVFAQHPKSMKKVVEMVLDRGNIFQLAGRRVLKRGNSRLKLPEGNGRTELVHRCLEILKKEHSPEIRWAAVEILRDNSRQEELLPYWREEVEQRDGVQRLQWLRVGLRLGVLARLQDDEAEKLMGNGGDAEVAEILYRGGHQRLIESNERCLEIVTHRMLDNGIDLHGQSRGLLVQLSMSINPGNYRVVFHSRGPVPLWEVLRRRYRQQEAVARGSEVRSEDASSLASRIDSVCVLARSLAKQSTETWATSLRPWDELVERGRRMLGESWSLHLLANTAAGVRSKSEKGSGCDEYFNLEQSLCERVRYARMRAGQASWWERQFGISSTNEQKRNLLLTFGAWAGAKTLLRLAREAEEALAELPAKEWRKLSQALPLVASRRTPLKRLVSEEISVSDRWIVLIAARAEPGVFDTRFGARLQSYRGNDKAMLSLCQGAALRAVCADSKAWRKWLPSISRSYKKGVLYDPFFGFRYARAARVDEMPEKIARSIVSQAADYPSEIASWAERICRENALRRTKPVGKVAARDRWFA